MKEQSKYNYSGNWVYCLGMIGAAVYYISAASGFMATVIGILKALVWPAFLVYEAFVALGAAAV
jgi:hypothetical protein